MDNSSVLLDNTQFRLKIGEVIEGSVNIMEKGTSNIFRELNRMREEYSSVINKCKIAYNIFLVLDFCEREGINLDFLEGENFMKSQSFDREGSSYPINLNRKINAPSGFSNLSQVNPNDKQSKLKYNFFRLVKIPSLEYKKFRMESKTRGSCQFGVPSTGSGTPYKNGSTNSGPYSQ
jgi:hypothetical protein